MKSEASNIVPPMPIPVFKKGNFDYIKGDNEREMISTLYNAVQSLEYWDFINKNTGPYMFNSDPKITRIHNKVQELGYFGHSGFSFAWTLRQIQFISEIGEQKYMEEWIKEHS